ncbi:HPP family protein [Drechmeria coniospora]|uniref:HPP family protein n=1 Tax=Drechmeria coniospora TaxID=98403 RepID=A0A151GPU9_DRECN|nr:HPP family protein [Drechmeria coniospora]KYK59032.1 HPP family protein [Drechmeria coniospora]
MRHRTWNFDIDLLLNPLVPPPPWRFLPYPVARFFGYRKEKPTETGNLMPIFWAFLGIFCSLLVIEAVSKRVPSFEARGAPVLVGSFGAAAVLEFYAIESPLAQPRNSVVGQIIAAVVGVAVTKLFQLSDRFHELQWIGGALACASATALMALTKTVHPPAGATALLAVVDANLVAIGWFLVPVMMLGCALMLAVALLVNNIERRFPMYWWTAEDLRQTKPVFLRRKDDEAGTDEEKADDGHASRGTETSVESNEQPPPERVSPRPGPVSSLHAGEVVIKPGQVIVPEHMFLTQEELQLLETMSYRL